MEIQAVHELMMKIKENVKKIIVGKEQVVDRLLIALISGGHVLLEDVPGTGKTLLAKAVAGSIDCRFKRIQFTPDLLPSDLSGIYYFNQKISEFQFRPGPIFANIVLADEINRATPRTQASLLECMEEMQVTVDGETKKLEPPFMVIATQNPIENQGTFPLPEAQLDRFLLKVSMGYPNTEEGVEILKRFNERQPLDELHAVADASAIISARQSYQQVKVSDAVLAYIVQIVERTRRHADILLGASPRGSQAMLKAAQVYAILQGRDYVLPDDVKAMAEPVLAHRILLKNMLLNKGKGSADMIARILQEVPVPTEVIAGRGSINQ
ncbi:MAG: magnesium chelatase [Paenibacillus sp. RIFOXYA1_FULL_44_5]|nr:MAG: magnesium chelatase [Paenibacillus sp. RIFOXYA1_FULL_44_5]